MRRRTFLARSIAAGTAIAATTPLSAGLGASERIGVAVVGVRGRGNNLLRTFASTPSVEVRYIADIDAGVLQNRVAETERSTGRRPEALSDFRRTLDSKDVDAVVLGTPDHWHAIPTILACQAGKDVYVEKPDGHNVVESFRMVAAQRKHKRVVQLGTQARSAEHVKEALAHLATGAIGKVRYATAWESAKQGSLGHPKESASPKGVDYDFWLGPAPKRAFHPMRFHGNWRWFFDYGAGDLGNDGVHRIDYARWALETAMKATGDELPAIPKRVSAAGGKLYFDDCQEWPDTLLASYDYGNAVLTYEMRIWTPYKHYGEHEGAAVFGDRGYVVIGNRSWREYSAGGELVKNSSGKSNLDQTRLHVDNFIECMKTREKPSADLETVGHPSSMLCHLGNAAWRAQTTLAVDPHTGGLPGGGEAERYLGRTEYRAPWLLPEV